MANSIVTNNLIRAFELLAGKKGTQKIDGALASLDAFIFIAIKDGNGSALDKKDDASQAVLASFNKATVKNGAASNHIDAFFRVAFSDAARQARTYYESLHASGKINSKGTAHMGKLLTKDDLASVPALVANVVINFKTSYDAYSSNLAILAEEKKAKTAETNAAKKAAEKLTNEIKEQEQRLQAERAAHDSFSLEQLLKAIKGGNIEALSLAEQIADVLTAYKLNKANKAAFIADKKAKANLSPVKLAA